MLPVDADSVRDETEPRTLYASGISYGSEAIAAREGALKSILYYPDEDFEYFDLSADPQEKHPLHSDQMTMRFDVLTGDYIEMKNTSLAVTSSSFDAETLEHLKSIGYLQGVEKAEPGEDPEKTPGDAAGDPEPGSPPE
jgi:hypothetical protein